jgi:hypothetical protein
MFLKQQRLTVLAAMALRSTSKYFYKTQSRCCELPTQLQLLMKFSLPSGEIHNPFTFPSHNKRPK